jgi:hypothetical protein
VKSKFSVVKNLHKLQPNPAWAKLPLFDRKGWKRMAFGDFAQSVGDRAEPKDAQEEIYVGLEHLDPHCLHIRRWGKGSDVTGTKLRFRKGDIIFGKRRAYQRKLAVAEFGGICSAHAMVIRAKPEKVLPEFMPFLMMSDRFMNRAVEISVGSLSPTINWTTLKLETFDLPPLDQQRRIAEILWAVDEDRQAWIEVSANTIRSRDVLLTNLSNQSHPKVACREILTLASGKSKPKGLRDAAEPGADVPVYGGNGIIGFTEVPLLSFQTLSIGRVGEYCGCVHFVEGASWITDNSIYVKEHSKKVELRFLYWVLRAANLNKKKKIAGQPLISQATITEQPIPLPSISDQRRFLDQIDQFTNAAVSSAEHASRSGKLVSAFLDTLFPP